MCCLAGGGEGVALGPGGSFEPLRIAATFWQKAKGLLLASPQSFSGTLLMPDCADVHTFGMRHRIDVAFADGAGVVVAVHRNVGSCRRLKHRRAVYALERFSLPDSPWLEEGDRLCAYVYRAERP